MKEELAYNGKNYSITYADGFFTLAQPQGTEVYELFDELVEAHPVCEESRRTFCVVIETAEMFGEYLPLDYAVSLADGLTSEDIDEDSAIVTKLTMQVERAGMFIERAVAADVLRGVCKSYSGCRRNI